MSEPAIELDRVSVRFGETVAVREVSLTVTPGELLVIIGGSGSGKTTLMKTINRLVEPTGGTVRLGGTDIRTLDAPALRRRIGYCFQKVGLFPHLTVGENVAITPQLLGWPPERIAARVDDLLTLTRLDPATYRDRAPDALSGGQQQRVGVARALAAEPEVVLFDEPFGALDPLTREELQEELAALREQVGLTGVFVTHDIVEAFLLGDRIAVLREGELLQVGTPAALREAPADGYVAALLETPARHAARLERRAESAT